MKNSAKSRSRKPRSLRYQTLENRQLMAADAAFDWAMEDRFGVDNDHDGRIDMWHDVGFIRRDSFQVEFDAASSEVTGLPHGAQPQYTWRIASTDTGRVITGVGETFRANLAQGEYFVNLTVDASAITGNPNDIDVAAERIRVRDILVLSMGDSYGSGEGNPEVPRNGNQPALWADEWNDHWVEGESEFDDLTQSIRENAPPEDDPIEGAHRSSKSASAVAALQLERSDPHTSVTYVSVAWTGAKMDRADCSLQPGDDGFETQHHVNDCLSDYSQIELAKKLIGDRTIDALALSVGGNDIGFADLATALAIRPPVDELDPYDLIPGDPILDFIESEATTAIGRLAGQYQSLHQQLENAWVNRGQLDPSNVFLVEYADPTWDADRGTSAILDDIAKGLEIDANEVAFSRDKISKPLADRMKQSAGDHGWTYVGGIASSFVGHGYAAEDPYDSNTSPSRARWFRTATDSRDIQGPYTSGSLWGSLAGAAAWVGGGPLAGLAVGLAVDSGSEVWDKVDTMGTLHPNELGHAKMGEILHDRLEHRFRNRAYPGDVERLELSPYVKRLEPVAGGFDLEFNQDMDLASLRQGLIVEDSARNPIGWTMPNSPTFGYAKRVSVRFQQPTPNGYRVLVMPTVINGYGWQMDQDRDGVRGETVDDRFDWEDFSGPRGIAYALPEYASVRLRFDEPIDVATFHRSQVRVTDAQGRSVLGVYPRSVELVDGSGGREIDVKLSDFPIGGFRLTVDPSVKDLAGIPLDQNGDGVAGQFNDAWTTTHVDQTRPQITGVGIARESHVLLGGGTALVVVSADEPLRAEDFRGRAELVHVDGRRATLGSATPLGHSAGSRHNYLLEFSVPDVGEYDLTIDAGIRDWFRNPTANQSLFRLRFDLTSSLKDRFDGERPDAIMTRPHDFISHTDPDFAKELADGPPVLTIDWIEANRQGDDWQVTPENSISASEQLDKLWSTLESESEIDEWSLLSDVKTLNENDWWI